jgi:Tol biopolymer transport system component
MRPNHRARLAVGLVVLLAACAMPVATPDPSASRLSSPSPSPTPSLARLGTPIPRSSLRGTIVYSSDVGGSEDVYLASMPDGDPIRLTDGPEKEFDPNLSPDGRLIAYRRNPRPGSDVADIWVMGIDGGAKRNLTDAPERMNWAPAWTPDGRIAFSRQDTASGALELWTMAADGSDQRRVAEGWCEYAAPSPDGSAFACSAAVDRSYDLVVVDARNGDRRTLVRSPQTEFGASWSPDGQWIAFSRDLGERWALLRIRPDGTGEEEVAREGVFSTWDPEGHLAWSGPGGFDVANADGSGHVALGYPASFISWRPG